MKAITLYIILVSMLFAGCQRMTPSGFWKDFDQQHQSGESNQGPWGGHLYLTWNNPVNIYRENDVVAFAVKNGWKLVDTKKIDTSTKNKPTWINFDGTLYKFESGWVSVQNDVSSPSYGYVAISPDNTILSVYHDWGE